MNPFRESHALHTRRQFFGRSALGLGTGRLRAAPAQPSSPSPVSAMALPASIITRTPSPQP
jgi:hypothetical protein